MLIEITDESLEDIIEQWLDDILEDLRKDKPEALGQFDGLFHEVIVAFLESDIRLMQSMAELDPDGVDKEGIAAARKLISRYVDPGGGSDGSETT